MSMKISPKNHLSQNAWIMPHSYETSMSLKSLQETMLATDGQILANGHFWTIHSKRMCPGVYKVWLKEKVYV